MARQSPKRPMPQASRSARSKKRLEVRGQIAEVRGDELL